mgnify:CR=1 FL=1
MMGDIVSTTSQNAKMSTAPATTGRVVPGGTTGGVAHAHNCAARAGIHR